MAKDLTPEEYYASLDSGVVPDSYYDTRPTQAQLYADTWVGKENTGTAKSSYYSPAKSWWDWDTKSWGKSTWNYDSIEERIKRKKKIETALDEFKKHNNIIAKTYIWADTSLVRKRGMYAVSVDNTDKYKEHISFLQTSIDVWKKLPSSDKVRANQWLLWEIISAYWQWKVESLFRWTQLFKDWNIDEIVRLTDLVKSTLGAPSINDEAVDFLLNAIPEQIKKEINEQIWHGWISSKVHRWKKIKSIKKPAKLTEQPTKFLKFPHLVKWKRINKAFIQQTDYRALKTKEKIVIKKKKLLILLDWSGSMDWEPYTNSINFIGSLMDANVFDVSVIHTTSSQVTDVTHHLKKWTSWATDRFIDTTGSEWFELLTDRLAIITRDEDYVIVLTDMCVPYNAEENLKAFIGTKKHLVLSFESKWSFKWNVRMVKTYKDMMAVVTTLLS